MQTSGIHGTLCAIQGSLIGEKEGEGPNIKLRILFLCLLIPITISGCYHFDSSLDAPSSKQNKVNLSTNIKNNYLGKWIDSNYQIVQMPGYTASFGSELYLMYKNDGIIEMNMYDISAPPANRIASVETEVKILTEGVGTFTFDDDGWGSHGSGTIELHEDQVIINIDSQIELGNNPDWRIYSGRRIFVRENI